jgi:AmmeMemoRadiSam system protein B
MRVRPSLAGEWYSKDPEHLALRLDEYLIQAVPGEQPQESILALVVPHAGHRYSGGIAAHGYATLRGFEKPTILILSPLHRPHPEPLLTSGFDAYGTPLGEVPVNRSLVAQLGSALRKRPGMDLTPIMETSEHAVEVQLPFLQRTVGEFDLLPIMISDQSENVARALAGAIVDVFPDQLPLLLASSDLSHFFPQDRARSLDGEILRRIESLDPKAVIRAEDEGAGYACGRAAIATALWVSLSAGANRAKLLGYATSGDVTGDMHSVVGYASVCIYHDQETE